MSRRELAEWLADKLNVPVAPSPLDPVVAPGLVLGPGNDYRSPLVACGWSRGVSVEVLGLDMDAIDVHDALDDLVDATLDALDVADVDVVGSVPAPAERVVGDKAHLATTIQARLP